MANVTFLPWRQQKSDQPARTFTTKVDFGAKSTSAPP